MASGKFYHIYITPKEGVSIDAVKAKMNLGLDWFKYDTSNYIVYSTVDIAKWLTRLKPLVEPDGRLFVVELNLLGRNGWMNKDFWEWLKKKRA